MLMRKLARRAGVTLTLGRLLQRGGYEAAFDDALFAEIKLGDIVWDVGANVGHYTMKFAEACGSDGRVVAFEPFPATLECLRDAVGKLTTVTVVPMALGADAVFDKGRQLDEFFAYCADAAGGGVPHAGTPAEAGPGRATAPRHLPIQPS